MKSGDQRSEIMSEHSFKTSVKQIPLPMQYLGGKGRIVDNILGGVNEHFKGTETFVDLFSGSGVVAFNALNQGYKVVANDIQPYSSAVLSSLMASNYGGIKELISYLSNVTDDLLFSKCRGEYIEDYFVEKSFVSSLTSDRFSWTDYKSFCEDVELYDGRFDIVSGEKRWDLFLSYYRNTYFGVKQCAEIDFLREISEDLAGNVKTHLIASVISSLTYCVSSTTHLAQYLKPSSDKNARNLLNRRNSSIINLVIKRLNKLLEISHSEGGLVYNLDFRDAIENIGLDSNTILYADPPYFKEHYSRYYHVLDTFVLYDYPKLTFNSRIGSTTVGRYRDDRLVSDFGKKKLVRKAFSDLIDTCSIYGNKLAISYACSSLVEKEFFFDYASSQGLKLKTLEFQLMHSGQGQSRHKNVTEYLFMISK
ncbi:adenine-specific DNA-methyltransferase [Vibrio crassostreae]|nr:adenine-specific DNA-methyltransferase [Vibrio crassostreae]CAK2094802.1 adenine-specific DNA-methyltransferase [Vibrio crassostreae]CAK2098627.1 adenine-specific DNA-methyltransferase [Vibrio crassostreae]CAK2101668.1 adenine-specific DNA-methyltransferase [Vibrio crassostreae]CAK2102541.1 adenine-specific DNA-methyltransferase [Vibrio crassostreae]